jgi:hypothetical protein
MAVNPNFYLFCARGHGYFLWSPIWWVGPWRCCYLYLWVSRGALSGPNIHRHGRYFADLLAARKLIQALDDRNVSYIREFDDSSEHGFQGMTKERMMRVIDYWTAL